MTLSTVLRITSTTHDGVMHCARFHFFQHSLSVLAIQMSNFLGPFTVRHDHGYIRQLIGDRNGGRALGWLGFRGDRQRLCNSSGVCGGIIVDAIDNVVVHYFNWHHILRVPGGTRKADDFVKNDRLSKGEWDNENEDDDDKDFHVVHKQLAGFVRKDKVMYGMMLRYEPIDIDELYVKLCTKYRAIICTTDQLKWFLDKEGIVFKGSEDWHKPKARCKRTKKK
ncbi:hypothetical protein BC938DRAFT_480128 [Jimgerdemannia flammicorona]|uniref:Structure-specific endonuclease subunit SLX4 n=1 Tax=Jimgerdemannia flammicorona TaxID=994334 RepID=A0A433QXQ3_9FUNG|nr:hypothetical protein BC938DRAFT_480128 [Jimgerdemannia flammicorona]